MMSQNILITIRSTSFPCSLILPACKCFDAFCDTICRFRFERVKIHILCKIIVKVQTYLYPSAVVGNGPYKKKISILVMCSLMYIKRNSLSCMQLFNLSSGEGGVQWNEGMCLTPHPFTYIMTLYDFHFTVFDQSLLLLLTNQIHSNQL